ncbi:MAG TPA: Rha family transcriptional regulator [Falsiroseomonas sp.]|jgi:Rha family phage regulatory protein|nr:Rha family transcriptional regulator [Falsiroseomonas sp.]
MTADDQNTPSPAEPIVFAADGKALANSRDVAAYFGKPHRSVLRAIRDLLRAEPKPDRHSFVQIDGVDRRGRRQPSYDMNRDGFVLLAMGFTGTRARSFKLSYIEAFNRMEAALRDPRIPIAPVSLPARRDLRDWTPEEMRAKGSVVRLYLRAYGPVGAQWVMPILGFPVPPKPLVRYGAQLSLVLDG